jgi:hypothetical protein
MIVRRTLLLPEKVVLKIDSTAVDCSQPKKKIDSCSQNNQQSTAVLSIFWSGDMSFSI